MSSAIYDLVRPEADFPAFDGAPRRSILICAERRSGSTLLCEAIAFARQLGRPVEYFQPAFSRRFVERWGADMAGYVKELMRYRTDPAGVFSTKLFWSCILHLARGLNSLQPGEETDDRALFAAVSAVFPNPEFVFLTRRDKIGQAVSLAVAAQTGQWRARRRPDVTRSDRLSFDFDMIAQALATFQATDARWTAFFHANNIEPLQVVYEDLVADYEGTVRRLLTSLGRPDADIVPPRLVKQSDARSDELRRSFLAEFRRRTPG